MKCLRAMKGENEVGSSSRNNDGDEIGLEEKLMVNNTVVDNELGGTDVGVKLSWGKVWAGVKKWELKPSTWLVTEYPGLCTARWTTTFLCGMANDWCGNRYESWLRVSEALPSFFSGDMDSALHFLRNVTSSVEESSKSTIVSIRENDFAISRGAAYGSDALDYEFGGYKSYNFEIESLQSSYPTRNVSRFGTNSREVAVAGHADTVELAKHLGVEKLSVMRRCFDRYRLPTRMIWRKAWYLLLEQCDCTPPENSPLSRMFSDEENIPFPYQLQMVAVWDECTNWRVLQASAQADISTSIDYAYMGSWNVVNMEPRTASIFEHRRRMASAGYGPRISMIGVSMESVRTFLAEWLAPKPDAVDWEPLITGEEFEFSVSSHLVQPFPDVGGRERMVWECQLALQSKLSKASTAHRSFASNAELMMLFILSMPSLSVEEEKEKREEVNGNEESGVSGTGNSVSRLGRAYSTVDVSVSVWRAWSTVEPQDVSVIIRIDSESGRASLSLQSGAAETRFKWEDWVNTAMGIMKGYDEANARKRGKHGETKRWLRKVDLGEPVVELCPLYWDGDDSMAETGTVRIWMGWRVFDARICKFEMEQWMGACSIDLKNIDGSSVEEKEVWHAEEVIRQMVKSGEFDVDGEA